MLPREAGNLRPGLLARLTCVISYTIDALGVKCISEAFRGIHGQSIGIHRHRMSHVLEERSLRSWLRPTTAPRIFPIRSLRSMLVSGWRLASDHSRVATLMAWDRDSCCCSMITPRYIISPLNRTGYCHIFLRPLWHTGSGGVKKDPCELSRKPTAKVVNWNLPFAILINRQSMDIP